LKPNSKEEFCRNDSTKHQEMSLKSDGMIIKECGMNQKHTFYTLISLGKSWHHKRKELSSSQVYFMFSSPDIERGPSPNILYV
jgi:hypothetical protein